MALLAEISSRLLDDAGAGTMFVGLFPFFFSRDRSENARGVSPNCCRS